MTPILDKAAYFMFLSQIAHETFHRILLYCLRRSTQYSTFTFCKKPTSAMKENGSSYLVLTDFTFKRNLTEIVGNYMF